MLVGYRKRFIDFTTLFTAFRDDVALRETHADILGGARAQFTISFSSVAWRYLPLKKKPHDRDRRGSGSRGHADVRPAVLAERGDAPGIPEPGAWVEVKVARVSGVA